MVKRESSGGNMGRSSTSSAAEQLERILYILPAAARDGGISLKRLARVLDVSTETLLDDLAQVFTRAYYHPAEIGSEIQVALERGRVQVFTTGEFRRPMRFSLREAICLAIALRGALVESATSPGSAPSHDREEAEHPSSSLSARSLVNLDERWRTEVLEGLEQLDLADLSPDPSGVRETLARCIAGRQKVSLVYLKPEVKPGPERRTVRPYALAHAEGNWYLLAHCEKARAVRVFRLDRVLEAAPSDRRFRRPRDFRPEHHLQGGRIFVSGEVCHVRIRYSPKIARWIAEREEGEWDFEGGLIVHRRVVDPGWLVRHVFQYGPEAEVLSPPKARRWVSEAVARVLEGARRNSTAVGSAEEA